MHALIINEFILFIRVSLRPHIPSPSASPAAAAAAAAVAAGAAAAAAVYRKCCSVTLNEKHLGLL